MKEWFARLLEEKNEITERIHRLGAFLNAGVKLNGRQRELMERQLKVMGEYEQILHERILLENEIAKDEKRKEF
jgi:hypothetical protein